MPLVADIHFQPAVAMMVADAFEKVGRCMGKGQQHRGCDDDGGAGWTWASRAGRGRTGVCSGHDGTDAFEEAEHGYGHAEAGASRAGGYAGDVWGSFGPYDVALWTVNSGSPSGGWCRSIVAGYSWRGKCPVTTRRAAGRR